MKQTLEIPYGNFVNSGSSLELIDLIILACLFHGKPIEHSFIQVTKKSGERLLNPYSISWNKLKSRLDVFQNLGYLMIQKKGLEFNLIVLKNTELLFNGLKVDELKKPLDAESKKEESEEDKMYLSWLIEKAMPHSTYVLKAKADQVTRQSLLRSYRMVRKIYSKEDVFHAIKFATSDDFWRNNFLSPLKLEQVQKSSGMKYIDLFLSLRNTSKLQSSSPSQKKENNSRSLD